jgi:general secretion pathway protein A
MEQQVKSNQLQKPSQETKPARAQVTLVEPTLTASSETRGHAGEKFEMGTGSIDSFSVDFQESARMLRDENPAETRDAAIVADSLLLRKESASLRLPEDRPLQNREAMVEETPGIEALLPADHETTCVREEVIARQLGLLTFYGLIEQPFDVTPDPAYLYLSQMHEGALTSLTQGIQNLRGFMALVAEPGLGKTTLLNKLIEELSHSARTVFLFQTQCTSRELLGYLLGELGIESSGMDVVAMHRALNDILFEEMVQGRRFVLIVDEAQNLDPSVMETIRLLSDFETAHTKLLQIVLAGQPQLFQTMMRPELAQLRQRVAVLSTLEPLDEAETIRYIEHRLRAAGASGVQIFTREALGLIAKHSKGVPRMINQICYSAMVTGHAAGCRIIGSDVVQTSFQTLCFESLISSLPEGPDGMIKPQAAVEKEANAGVALTGRVSEKLRTRTWESAIEYKILVSLERASSLEIPIADRYYCATFHVSEEQAKDFRPGQSVKIRIEPQ